MVTTKSKTYNKDTHKKKRIKITVKISHQIIGKKAKEEQIIKINYQSNPKTINKAAVSTYASVTILIVKD